MSPFSLTAPAKLNLFLHITGQRADGYHELQTVFQLLDYGDTLHFEDRRDTRLSLHIQGPLPLTDVADEDNLVLRAATLLRQHTGCTERGATIVLDKCLPSGGGLGGGSSDAASTLLGLNQLWSLQLSVDTLAGMGRQLGADVPVFVRGHSAWAEGVGDILMPMELPPRWFMVIHPGCAVATPVIFSRPELTRDTPAITMAAFFAGPTRNDCENTARGLSEPVDKALKFLQNFGEGRMTGTGACVFLSFENHSEAQEVLGQVPQGWRAFVARGLNRSPALEQLDALANASP